MSWRALLVSRAVVWGAGMIAIAVFGLDGDHTGYDPAGVTAPFGSFGDLLVGPAARWDARWFLEIAEHGYGDEPRRAAFFPLYPLLVRLVDAITGAPAVAGMVVSIACLGGALVLLHRLTELELGLRAATATTWLVALGPMAFFFSAIYSEALFLLLSVGAVYLARRERWLVAGLLALLAACTRSAGVLLLVPLAMLAWQAGRRRDAGWALLALGGPAGFSVYLELDGAGWRALLDAQAIWGREFAGPVVAAFDGARTAVFGVRDLLADGGGRLAFQNVLSFAFLVLAVPCLVGVFRRLPLAYGLYSATLLGLALSYPVDGRPLLSFPRFAAAAFPLWMWLGWWISDGEPRRAWAVGSASVAGLVLFTALFSTWIFVS